MLSQPDYKELLRHQCSLTDLFRNQLQLMNFELHKARGTIQNLHATLISLQHDFDIKSEFLSASLTLANDDQRISTLEESFKKDLTLSYLPISSPSPVFLFTLPIEILFMITEYLRGKELTVLSYTCKDVYVLCQSRKLWQALAKSYWAISINSKQDFLEKYQREMSWYHTRPVVSTLLGHSGSVTCISYQVGKSHFISASDDSSLIMWEIDESRLKDKEIVKQHHVQTKNIAKKTCFYGHGGPVWSCCEGPDGALISASYDKTIKLWNLNTGRCDFTLRGHNEWVSSVDCNAEIICSGSWDSTVKIWDYATKTCINTFFFHPNDAVYCLQIWKNQLGLGLKSNNLELWDLEQNGKIMDFFGHFKGINSVKLDDRVMLSGSSDSFGKVWDLRTGECVSNLIGHNSNVMCVDYDSTSQRAVTGSYDKTIRIWDLRNDKTARTVLRGHSDPVFCMKSDDHKLISGSMDQSIKIWNFQCM